jgi:hypothetical protein
MKLAALALGALIALPAQHLAAQRDHVPQITIQDDDDNGSDVVRPGPRHSARDARISIRTTDDVASFVLTSGVVALQLTDRTLRHVDGEMEREVRKENGIFASMIVSAVRGTVTNALRRSLEVPIRDLRTVDYRNGRLVFITEDGERIFENVEIDDTDVTASFSARDAQAFVREFRALKARTR